MNSREEITTPWWRKFDWVLLLCTLALSSFGLVMIYSATSDPGPLTLNPLVIRQFIYLIVGLLFMSIMATVDYRFLLNWKWVIYGLVLFLLTLVFVIGHTAYGSTRWIDLGPFPLQPSELAKLLMVLVLAGYLCEKKRGERDLKRLITSICIIAPPTALVFLQPDLGTSMVLGAAWVSLVLFGGIPVKYLMRLFLLLIPFAVVGGRFLLKPYQIERIAIFLRPEDNPFGSGYNIIQATISVGSGGFWGQGFMSGSQSQLHYLRVQHTDFIASVIGEEFGFIGMMALLVVYGLLLWRIIRIASKARDKYGELIAVGIAAIILFQVFVNIGMNIQLMPVTGIPLPFISYGGSSLVTLLTSEGILQSIILRHKKVNL